MTEQTEYQKLLSQVQSREKVFADGWWKAGAQAVELYNNEKDDAKNPYNILYSNTEVLKPSLYSATPKPDVRGRFVESPVSPLTKMVERLLIIFSDPSNPGEESLDQAMSDAVTSALVSGLGCIRLKLYPSRPFPICPQSVHFKGLIWASGRKWADLPWIAFRHELTRSEFFSQFSIKGEAQSRLDLSDDPNEQDEKEDFEKNRGPNCTVVYELWRKSDRKVIYLCEDWDDVKVKEESDPMGLSGFWPTPGPLLLTQKPGRLLPTPLYQYYRNQAEELNRVTARLNKILSAIKVRGAYNSLLGEDMQQILASEDTENKLVPAKEAGMLAQNGGFERQIWLLPIEKLVEVATQLYAARMQIKQVIYEITGLSDIIRGSSVASETATAQNLKNKWGSIRLRDMQKSTANYVRDLYRLTVDLSTEKIPEDKWKSITQAPFPTGLEKKAAIEQIQYSIQNQLQPQPEVVKAAQAPSIEELLSQIKSDANRTYTINVQSDSTVDLDTATDKQEVEQFMNAMGQLLAGLQPLATLGPTGLNAGKEILIAVCSRYKFGLSILDSLKALEAPPPQQNGPTPEQAQKEKDLQTQEKQLQGLVVKLEDVKRDIETQRKEFDADVKVFKAEQAAQERIQAANQQVEGAKVQAKEAQDKAVFVERQSSLKAASAEARTGAKVQKQVQDTTTPVVQELAKTVQALASEVESIQKAVETVAKSAKKPSRIRKEGSTYIPEYDA